MSPAIREPAAPRSESGGGHALWWWIGTILVTAATLYYFHLWGRPYLNVENEGQVQVTPADYSRVAAEVSPARLQATVEKLAGFGSRLSGSAGADGAAAYLKEEMADLLGPGNVREERFDIDNPFDLGCEMDAGGEVFRAHPMWAPFLRTYRLPAGGRDLGAAVRLTLGDVLRGDGRIAGAAVAVPWIEDASLRQIVLAAWRAGKFKRKLRDPLTKGELALLARLKPGTSRTAEDDRMLDILADKHQAILGELFFDRLTGGDARCLLILEPAGGTRRVVPRSFADRILKYPSDLPRYLVGARHVEAVRDGVAVRVRQARSALRLESGESLRVYPFWPNLMRTCSTPRDGIEGKLVWGGRASLPELSGRSLRGAIVMVDFNCGYQWVGLADLGAAAILFLEPPEIMRGESENKYLSLPADIPRFWVPREEADRLRGLEGTKVRLDSQVVWERRAGRNLIGVLKGTGRATDPDPVVITAQYDSVSVVPDLAPGGDQASGAATLLELIRVLKRHPLKKDTLFVLTSAHCQNLKGWAEFIHRHYITLEKKEKDPDRIEPAFAVDLDLTTRTRRLAVFFKGHRLDQNEGPTRRVYSTFGRNHAQMGAEVAKALGYGPAFMADAVNAVSGRTWDSYIPGPFALAQEITMNAGLYGIAYATPDDERVWVDTPHDTPSRMDFESLTRQARVLACVLPNQLNVGAAFSSSKVVNYWTSLKGRVVEWVHRESFLPDKSLNGAIVWTHHWWPVKSLKGVRGYMFTMALGPDQGGANFELHGLGHSSWLATQWKAHAICEAYELDPMDGEVRYAPDRGPEGSQAYTVETDMDEKVKNVMLVVFPCRPLLMFDLVDPLRYTALQRMQVYDARTDSEPSLFGAAQPEQNWLVTYVEPLATAFAPEGTSLKFTFWAGGFLGKRCALVNSSEALPEGIGFDPEKSDRITFTARQVAIDMWRLNEYRLKHLKVYGIVNHFLEDLHVQAKERLERMQSAMRKRDWRAAVAEARAAWGLSARVYPAVEQATADVVHSAVLYLALLVPFAFLAERLFFAFNNVTKQVAGAMGVFLGMFGILWFVHPAFRIALTPIMILLAFIILALSVVVSGIIASRFFDFLRRQRESLQGVHEADVSKISVAIAAFLLGVSNMRKRPLRTALTCLTLVVLTFAVLSLTSVQQAVKQRKYSIGKKAAYEGLLFRQTTWGALAEPALKYLETELANVAVPIPRAWYVSYASDRQNAVEIACGDKARATAVAALGLTWAEPSVSGMGSTVVAGRWIGKGETRVCLLPRQLAATLYIGEGDLGRTQVVIFGVPFTVIGLFDPRKVGKLRDLDDEEISPVNFEATEKRRASQNITTMQREGQLPQKYDHHDAGQIVIMPYEDLMRLNGRLASIAVPLPRPQDLRHAIDRLLSRLGLLVYVGLKGKTYAYSAIGDTPTEGLGNLVAPVAIAVLIVLSTMLGAVQERRREIAVFSSVGLSPTHVAVLFLAESFVYAILGVVIGYLLGQMFSHLVVTGVVLQGLNVNYSSGSAILSVVVVMGVVLGSTLYPAYMASRLARPSTISGFVLPPLVGDKVALHLPFSFNARDAEAVCAFLAEFFDAHAEASAGEFSSGNIRLERKGPECVLGVRVWLAPYDFGVSQDIRFTTREGIGDESSAKMEITRLSGDQASWRRVNNRFLKTIRKQFLIWRALGEAARTGYQQEARRLVAQAKEVAHAA